jgi:hypothetical protein
VNRVLHRPATTRSIDEFETPSVALAARVLVDPELVLEGVDGGELSKHA